jgi:hypothetical protein
VSERARVLALGLAGLAIASLLGLTGYLVSRETIALPATSLSAGEGLAPTTAAATRRDRPATTADAGPTTAATTEREVEPAGTEDSEDDSGRGRGRGRGGDSGSGSGSGSGSDSSGSGSDSSGSGSGDSGGSGRGRGRGGDDD